MPEFFVIVGESKKICTSAKEDLLKTIRFKFNVPVTSEIILQTYSATYEDWLDTEVNDLPDGGKVNVIMKNMQPVLAVADQNQSCNSSPSVQHLSCTPENEAGVHDAMSSRWPSRFILPVQKFGHLLKTSLESNTHLTPALSSSLMDALYSEITRYTFYPTHTQYNEVIQALMAEYPYLRKMKIGNLVIEGDNCVRKWRNTLADKFRNMRKRRDRSVPEVSAKCRGKRAAVEGPTSTRPKKISNQWGVANFLPERPITEDDASIKRSVDWMRAEAVRRRPDMSGIKLRMELTFADRRRMVVNQLASVEQIKMEFPCLFMEEEILNEFHRLTEMSIDENFLEGLKKYGQAILDKAPQDNGNRKCVLNALSGLKTQEDRNRLTAYGALLVLPSMLKEDISNIICPENMKPDHVATPLLLHEGDLLDGETDFRLLVDNEEVAKPLDFIQAIECLMASYYVFNIAYPQCILNSLTFFQKVIIGLTDKTPNPRKVLTLMTKLCK